MLTNIQQIKQHPRYVSASRVVRTPEFKKRLNTAAHAGAVVITAIAGAKLYRQGRTINALSNRLNIATSKLHKSKAAKIRLASGYRGLSRELGDITTQLETLKSVPGVRGAVNRQRGLRKLQRLRDQVGGTLIRVQNSKAGPALGKLEELGPIFKMAAIKAGLL